MRWNRMDDLISRRAAINAMCDNCNTVEAKCAHFPCERFLAMEQLPSADVPVTNVGDMISRQAAIDAIKETPIYVTLDYGIGAFPVISTETALNKLVDLPSAEDVVEVVRCKDCQHLEVFNDKDYYARCKWHGRLFSSFGNVDTRIWYCADGERRTDG